MDATIVIASLNESANLARTIQSCLDTTDGLDYEIVVADDSSADGSIDELATQHPGVRIVRHERRQGVASTKDLGARSASGDVLVFLDGHCKPEPGAIARLVADVRELDGRAVITAATAAAARTRSARRRRPTNSLARASGAARPPRNRGWRGESGVERLVERVG